MSALGAPFSFVYRGLSLADRALTWRRRLNRPVVSVGNIASGGRGKTPFVIEICERLLAADFEPVVLTRGYGRATTRAVVLEGGTGGAVAESLDVDLTGDEPLEIHVLTGATVCVGADRASAAKDLLGHLAKSSRRDRLVFVLDDGFQHAKLARDFDLVLTAPEDARDHLLPWGRLREPVSALERASVVLERGRDFEKRTALRAVPANGRTIAALTTRAPDPAYFAELTRLAGRPVEPVALRDHADRRDVREALARVRADDLIVGLKEAAKILPNGGEGLAEFAEKGFASVPLADGSSLGLYAATCRLEFLNDRFEAAWTPFVRSLR